jgi:CHAT domain-containing protein/tetratricopeptide (TPR) repeat protein
MRVLRFAVLFFGGSLALSAMQSEVPLSEVTLSSPGTVSRSLRAGETHGYRVAVAANERFSATVTSRPGGARLRLAGPGGEAREISIGTQGGGARPDPVTAVGDAAGEWRIAISAGANSVEYTLAVDDLRAATESDRLRATAEQLYWDAQALSAKRGVENFRGARSLFERSLAIWQTLGDQWFLGNVLNEIGGIHRLLAQNDEALDFFNRALPVLRASGNLRDLTGTLNNIAAIAYSRGEVRKAFDHFDQAIRLAQTTGDRQAQSILLNNMGTLALAQGDHQRALDLFNQALVLRRAVGDVSGEIRTLNNLSLVFRLLGDTASSKNAARQALAFSEPLGDRQLRAASLNSLGTIERVTGELEPAEQHLQQALVGFRESGELRLASATLNNLGEIHVAQGRRELARTEFEQALSEARRAEERQREAYTLRNLGALAAAERRHDLAWTHFEQSLEIERTIRNQEGEAESLREMARTMAAREQFDQALAYSEPALSIVESLRSKVGNPQLRTTYFSSKRPFYELHVDVLMQNASVDRVGAAFEASERARARSLLDLLRESGIAIREGVDPALLEREESLRQRINVVDSSRVRALTGKPDPQLLASIGRELDDLFREYQQLQVDVRARSPHYAAISQAEGFGTDEVQQALDSDTVLLEYLLGDDRSYVWVVTRSSIAGYALPARATIESLVRQVYPRIAREATVAPSPARRQPDDVLRRSLTELSRLLLGPVAAHLGRHRLVVVADGALLYLPFTLLESPVSPDRPLLVDHEVVHLPSMSSLLAMRRTRMTPLEAPSVGIIADPVFSLDDSRVVRRGEQAGVKRDSLAARDGLARAAADGGIVRFPRLRFTRQEASAIASFVPPARRFEALDFAANRETARSDRFARQTILHFATHGIINSVHPELSGVVLSLVDARGTPQEGFLRLHDIYNLQLNSALVVLSACQTALGQDIRGEGLIGLTRGFMYAGAPRIVASLWAVDDRATAELMKHFYQGMLIRGATPAAALREAQLAVRRDRRWSDAYYWGAFVLQGEWR